MKFTMTKPQATSSRPIPGSAKIDSTISVPPSRRPILMPVTVTSVSDEGLSACTNRMRDGLRPLALASAQRLAFDKLKVPQRWVLEAQLCRLQYAHDHVAAAEALFCSSTLLLQNPGHLLSFQKKKL